MWKRKKRKGKKGRGKRKENGKIDELIKEQRNLIKTLLTQTELEDKVEKRGRKQPREVIQKMWNRNVIEIRMANAESKNWSICLVLKVEFVFHQDFFFFLNLFYCLMMMVEMMLKAVKSMVFGEIELWSILNKCFDSNRCQCENSIVRCLQTLNSYYRLDTTLFQ